MFIDLTRYDLKVSLTREIHTKYNEFMVPVIEGCIWYQPAQ